MDELMKGKLVEIANDLENTQGKLKLFACVWRSDINKWDIVISASWVKDANLKAAIGWIFDAFKKQFNGEYALRFSGIYPLRTNATFVETVTKLFAIPSGTLEVKQVQLGSVMIDEMVLVISQASADKNTGPSEPLIEK